MTKRSKKASEDDLGDDGKTVETGFIMSNKTMSDEPVWTNPAGLTTF